MQILLTILVSSPRLERSFSKLKLIHVSNTQARFIELAILSIENDKVNVNIKRIIYASLATNNEVFTSYSSAKTKQL